MSEPGTQINFDAVARIVARAVLRERFSSMSNFQFDQSCEISGEAWTYQDLAGVLKGFRQAGLIAPARAPEHMESRS